MKLEWEMGNGVLTFRESHGELEQSTFPSRLQTTIRHLPGIVEGHNPRLLYQGYQLPIP